MGVNDTILSSIIMREGDGDFGRLLAYYFFANRVKFPPDPHIQFTDQPTFFYPLLSFSDGSFVTKKVALHRYLFQFSHQGIALVEAEWIACYALDILFILKRRPS